MLPAVAEDGGHLGEQAGLARTLHLVQSRYGYTDDYCLSLPYARLMQLADMAAEAERHDWEKLAFIGWQVSGSQATFAEYLARLGLGPQKEERLTEDDRTAAWAAAEDALKALRGGN